jgi:capsid protein
MLNWLFKTRSAADPARDRRNIGLWNDPTPDYSRTAPNPIIRNRARFLVANSAVAARAVQAFVDNVVGPGITLLPKISSQNLKAVLLDTWNAWTDVAAAGSLRLQLLPAEFIDTTITRDNVIAGIEFDAAGRRTAFYIYEWHPGNLLRLPKSNRVPSTEVLQIFRPAIPGQVRGVSALLPIMTAPRW